MTRQETLEPVIKPHNSVDTSSNAGEDSAHPPIYPGVQTYLGQSLRLPARSRTQSEPARLSTSEKRESSRIQEHLSRGRKFTRRSPREVAEIIVRVAILAGIVWFVLIWTGIAIPTQREGGRAVDFSTQLNTRGGSNLPSSLSSVIPCAPLRLVIHLGRESGHGPLDVALVQDGMRYAYASGIVKLEDHQPVLRVKLDLSQVPTGESQLGIRPAGGEWRYHKVILKSDQRVSP